MKAWKLQKFFGDVVYDLRNRGLLPVVGLLIVAMIAVPILLSRGGGNSSGSSLQAASATTKPAPEAERAVVSYTPPGVRNYKQRLNDQSVKDPFRQQFIHVTHSTSASQLNSTALVPSSTGSSSSSVSSSSTGAPTGTTTSNAGGGSGAKKKSKKVSYQVNVLAGNVNATLTPFDDVQAMTTLPSQTTPVVLYYGLTSDNKQAQFLVSNKVTTVNGPGSCIPSPDDCALLTLGPGQSEDLAWAGDGNSYRIVVAAIKTIRK